LKSFLTVFLMVIVVSGFSLVGINYFGGLAVNASDALNVQLDTRNDGQASFSSEKVHTSPYSAKLVIPVGASRGSCAIALYPYNGTLNSLSTFSIFASYVNAVPSFVIYLDKNGDGVSDSILMSDHQLPSNGEWKISTGGNIYGWTEANYQLSIYGITWKSLDDWKNDYGSVNVLYVGIALEYWAVDPDGYGEPLYADELMLNGATPTYASGGSINVHLDSRYYGQASFTDEKVHTSSNSAKLVIPTGASPGSCAIALYPYNKPLSALSTFSVFASYFNATPRFVIYLDKNGDGVSDSILLSDYQLPSNGEWKVTTGGDRWGWTEANHQLSSYGSVWQQLDHWKTEYGNTNVPYVGIALEYWAVDPDGFGEPLYADELILNDVIYNIAPVSTPEPSPDSNSWPMFHNDLAHSGYAESAGPLTNQVLWKYQVGSSIESSPTVVDGVVYFGSLWNGNNGFVNALNATTGEKIWQFATDSGVESSPAVVDGVVYIGSWGGHVYALDAASGAEIWSFNAGGSVFPSPAVVDGVVYVGSASGHMYALNAANGLLLWSYHTSGAVLSSPAVVDGVVYFGSEDQNFYALRASDGVQIWHFASGGFIDGSPVVGDGIVYFGSRDGYVYALNATDGSQIWSFRPSHGNYGSYYYSTPAVANGVIYVGGYDSYIYALNATIGDMFWEFRTGGYIFSSPIVAGAVVYVGSYDGNVYALDAITGSKIWSYQTGGKMRSSCAAVNGRVYVGSDDGYLYAFGFPSGQPTSYKISGYILDANGNGIGGANIIFNVPSIVPSVWSDSSGHYVISAPAGTYHVNVWPPFDSHYINYDEPGFTVGSDMTKNMTLQSGYKVSGYISDASGKPVVGAVVLLDNFGSGWFSNSEGYYFLSVLAGTYTINAHPRTGNYYSGPTTDFPPYHEHNFTVNCDTVKNITVGVSSPTSSLKSEPASSPEPSPEPSLASSPEPSPTPPPAVAPDQITISTKSPAMTLLGLVLGIGIVASPFVAVISVCLLFYFKKRKY
jgi:outer membrane protein assembly factor BamB